MEDETRTSTDRSEREALLLSLRALERTLEQAGTEVDGLVAPVRKTFFKRFPTLFLLLTTLGATAVFLGLERILLMVDLFDNKPWLLFLLGVAILALTGRLAKKLD